MNGYNFTERVRQVLQNARLEAQSLHHEYVGTEHLLLGLIGETEGVVSSVLENLKIDVEGVRRKVLEICKKGQAVPADVNGLPYTSRAKKVLELAMTEARELHHAYVGTEHLLLGLLREEKGIGAQVLMRSGLTLEASRAEAIRLTGRPEGGAAAASDVSSREGELQRPVLVPLPRTPPYQLAFTLFWWTLGIVVLIESIQAFVQSLTGTQPISLHMGILASVEIIGAVLFLIPRTLKYGALILLAVFAVAIVAHFLRGEFPAPLLVYAAGTMFVLVQRTGGVRVTPLREP